LLSDQQRRDQAAYFTPPYLANAVLDLASEFGFGLTTHTVLDPAAGGAAFLSTIAGRMAAAGVDNDSICSRLEGAEIDPGLARISRALLAERLKIRKTSAVKIAAMDALNASWENAFDLVVANPPYGRRTRTSPAPASPFPKPLKTRSEARRSIKRERAGGNETEPPPIIRLIYLAKTVLKVGEQPDFVRTGAHAQGVPIAAPRGRFQGFPGRRRSALAD
jgi:hypothetical protein